MLFDEAEHGRLPAYHAIKLLCDGREQRAPVKGGSMLINPHTVIFCSNSPVTNWWPNVDLDPFRRRIEQGGGAVATWDGAPSDYVDARVHPPDNCTYNHVWVAYPDPPNAEAVPRIPPAIGMKS